MSLRILFLLFIDSFEKATKKLKKYEDFSDVQSSAMEDVEQPKKRQRKQNSKYTNEVYTNQLTYSSEEDTENTHHSLRQPPKILRLGKRLFFSVILVYNVITYVKLATYGAYFLARLHASI